MAMDMITSSSSSPSPVKAAAPEQKPGAPAVASDIQRVQQAPQPARKPVDDAELEAAVSKVADYVQNVQRNLSFSVDKESGHTVVKVIDSKSDEVIRQIPSEELLALARRLTDMHREDGKGVLVQSSA
jgi:flagellar protein FlaG